MKCVCFLLLSNSVVQLLDFLSKMLLFKNIYIYKFSCNEVNYDECMQDFFQPNRSITVII